MLHRRDATTTDIDALQILEALEGTKPDHKLWKELIGKVPRERQLS